MNKLIRNSVIIVLCSTLSSLGFSDGFLARMGQSQHQLSEVKQQIQQLENELNESKSQKDKVQQQLQKSETSIGDIDKKISITNAKLNLQLTKLAKAEARRDHLRVELKEQQQLLEQHIHTAYMLGREQEIKVLLNQQNPADIGRYITYSRYLVQARKAVIKKIHTTNQALQTTLTDVQQQASELRKIKRTQEDQHTSLQHAQNIRKDTLSKIKTSISSKQAELVKLYSDKKRLQTLVKTLSKESYYITSGADFAADKGKLPWPLKHFKVIQSYNQLIADNRMRSTGMLLQADAGTPIHAIYSGKVVFAHWLRGFGLLLVVQHGKSFMSLYGRCQSLYVQQGSNVKPGQVIATVGNSGGYQTTALYFELRHLSSPIDPFKWLRKQHG